MMYSMIAPDSAMVLPLSVIDGRFAERMNRAQFGRRAHVGLTLIADDLVGDAEFFQQPQHALRAGIVEMMDGEHGISPQGVRANRAASGRASGPLESRDAFGRVDITRMLLTN